MTLDDEGLELLREARRWLGDGELSDGLPREHWTKQYADAVDAIDAYLARPRQKQAPATWCVVTEDGPNYCAGYPEACHEHINDAINEYDIEGAEKWRVVPLYYGPKRQMTEADVDEHMKHVQTALDSAWNDGHDYNGTQCSNDSDATKERKKAIRAHLMQFVGSGG